MHTQWSVNYWRNQQMLKAMTDHLEAAGFLDPLGGSLEQLRRLRGGLHTHIWINETERTCLLKDHHLNDARAMEDVFLLKPQEMEYVVQYSGHTANVKRGAREVLLNGQPFSIEDIRSCRNWAGTWGKAINACVGGAQYSIALSKEITIESTSAKTTAPIDMLSRVVGEWDRINK